MNKGEPILDSIPQDIGTLLIDYVSNALSADERDAFEKRLLEDEFFHRKVEEAEFLLLEAYAEGALPAPVHDRVAAWVASSPHHRRQVEITRSLRRLSAADKTGPSSSRLRLWAVAAAVGIAAVSLFPLLLRRHTPPPALQLTATNSVAPLPLTAREDTILLVAERLRGAKPAEPSTFQVHAQSAVRLQIIIRSAHATDVYAMDLRGDGTSAPAMHFNALKLQGTPTARFLEVTIPPHTLEPGSYVAEITAPSERFSIPFRAALPR